MAAKKQAAIEPLVLTYTIQGKLSEVYRAWTVPKLIQRWGPEKAEADVRLGGRFRFETDADAKGSLKHVVSGEYKIVEPLQKLQQTWTYEGPDAPHGPVTTLLTVHFKSLGPEEVEITICEEGPSLADPEARETTTVSWLEALKMLEIICAAS